MDYIILFLVLCQLFHLAPDGPLLQRSRVVQEAADEFDVPVALLAAVCWASSGMGTEPTRVSLCGSVSDVGLPIPGDRDSARVTAQRLYFGHGQCGTWEGALTEFRTHTCQTRSVGWQHRVLITTGQIAREWRNMERRHGVPN